MNILCLFLLKGKMFYLPHFEFFFFLPSLIQLFWLNVKAGSHLQSQISFYANQREKLPISKAADRARPPSCFLCSMFL